MKNRLTTLWLAVALLLATACQPIQAPAAGTIPPAEAGAPTATSPYRQQVTAVDFLGEVTFATGTIFADTELGGLSGLVYAAETDLYYAISDDRSQRNPARLYTLTIDLSDGQLAEGDVVFQGATTLLDESGVPYPENGIDPEGIARTADGRLFISSEGNVNAEPPLNPFIREHSVAGDYVAEIALPAYYLPNADRTAGIRNNLAFESLVVSLDGDYLWTAVEGALAQDGPIATLENESLVRILQLDLASGEPVHEYVYVTDAIPQAPDPADGAADNGLVDLLPLDTAGTFLAMERGYAQGVGNNIRLYQAQTNGALDVLGRESLLWEAEALPYEMDPPVAKTLLADRGELGATLDNMEGMSYGPLLPDGRQTVIISSDNNFNETQQTVIVALALTIAEIPTAFATVETPYTVDEADVAEGVLAGDSDDPAIYVHPTDPAQSMVLATLKDGGLVVFDLAGNLLDTVFPAEYGVDHGEIRYNNVDLVYGFPLGDTTVDLAVDLAVASDRQNDTIAVFAIDPATRTVSDITAPDMITTIFGVDDGEQTAYGLATYTEPATGNVYVYITQADGAQVAQLQLRAAGNGQVTAAVVRMITVPAVSDDPEDSQTEGLVVDRELGFLYVALEDGVDAGLAIVKYDAAAEGGDNPEPLALLATDALLPDVEGLTIYYGPDGSGYLLASSQGDSTYAVYERAGDNAYLGSFAVGGRNGIDAANESDGADLINVSLGDAFPNGLLVVQDGANEPQYLAENDEELENRSTNFKFVPWENVANAFAEPLLIDPTSYHPRTVGNSGDDQATESTDLTVMTFNVWGGGANEGKPVDETVAAIQAAGADIIGVQETRLESDPCTAESCPATGPSVAQAVADALGFYYYDQTQENVALWSNAVISRYPIGDATPNDLGVAIDVDGRTVYAFNIHLTDFPYQPYQLLNIDYGDAPFLATAEEAVAAAQAARGPALELLMADLAAADGADAAFIFGDFNEPSHWDWTEAAVTAGLQPLIVEWPTTVAIESQGFLDAFRTANPDVVAQPAFTWTPTSDPSDPEDHHDRIDFVFARGAGLTVEEAHVVGEKSPEADIVVTPWPSDHRAIVAKVRF